jgi:signal transduction histidine kinase
VFIGLGISFATMKLLNKTNLYFLGTSLLIFCLGGILFFYLFQEIIDQDIDNKLHQRKDYIVKQFAHLGDMLLFQRYSANTFNIIPSTESSFKTEVISDTLMYDAVEKKFMGYRQLSFTAKIDGEEYTIFIRRGLIEQKELIEGVIILEVVLFLAFAAMFNLINSQLSKKLWKPFYNILEGINNYKIDKAESLTIPRSSITEFNELATSIEKMTNKINLEFNVQKEFTENASHEIQTPLAIIKNKMEILLQSPELTEIHLDQLNSMYSTVSRLSKLNEALVILSRIENRQFHEVVDICVNDMIDYRLESLEELIQMKNITVRRNCFTRRWMKMNVYLADILFENLIVNAIKHNHQSGAIVITINPAYFLIANSGEVLQVEPEKLFSRFSKSNKKSLSLGLGLSIAKAICDTYTLPIHYRYQDGLHKISVEMLPATN